jgi:tellurite resistance protein TerC
LPWSASFIVSTIYIYGLSLVLVLVGTKMLVNAAFDVKIIPTELALTITALLIGGSMLVSVIKTRHFPKEMAGAEVIHGWVPGSPGEKDAGADTSSRPLGTGKTATDKKDS